CSDGVPDGLGERPGRQGNRLGFDLRRWPAKAPRRRLRRPECMGQSLSRARLDERVSVHRIGCTGYYWAAAASRQSAPQTDFNATSKCLAPFEAFLSLNSSMHSERRAPAAASGRILFSWMSRMARSNAAVAAT